MPFPTWAPTGVAGIDDLSQPAVENPGVEICPPVAVVLAEDCTNQPSWSETATFSSDPCASPTEALPSAKVITNIVMVKRHESFINPPWGTRREPVKKSAETEPIT